MRRARCAHTKLIISTFVIIISTHMIIICTQISYARIALVEICVEMMRNEVNERKRKRILRFRGGWAGTVLYTDAVPSRKAYRTTQSAWSLSFCARFGSHSLGDRSLTERVHVASVLSTSLALRFASAVHDAVRKFARGVLLLLVEEKREVSCWRSAFSRLAAKTRRLGPI